MPGFLGFVGVADSSKGSLLAGVLDDDEVLARGVLGFVVLELAGVALDRSASVLPVPLVLLDGVDGTTLLLVGVALLAEVSRGTRRPEEGVFLSAEDAEVESILDGVF